VSGWGVVIQNQGSGVMSILLCTTCLSFGTYCHPSFIPSLSSKQSRTRMNNNCIEVDSMFVMCKELFAGLLIDHITSYLVVSHKEYC
jgi:hypothetical protein